MVVVVVRVVLFVVLQAVERVVGLGRVTRGSSDGGGHGSRGGGGTCIYTTKECEHIPEGRG